MDTLSPPLTGRGPGLRTDYDAPRFADRYIQARSLDVQRQTFWVRTLARAVPAAEVTIVLDLGAGVGRFWPVIAAAWHPRLIVAADSSAEMLHAGVSPQQQLVARVVADIDAVPLRPGTVDACFCSMAIQYSSDPARAISQLKALLRPGGYLCIRTGTSDTLETFDFLRFFPTALSAETRAMPQEGALLTWIKDAGLEILQLNAVVAPAERSRRRLLYKVIVRGFPSLQLVSGAEYVLGAVRFGLHLAFCWIRGARPRGESVVFVVARRSAQ